MKFIKYLCSALLVVTSLLSFSQDQLSNSNLVGVLNNTYDLPAVAPVSIVYFGTASDPADNGTSTSTVTVVPPASMVRGDIVLMFGHCRSTALNPDIVQTGSQVWTTYPLQTATSMGIFRAFFCVFNGTWTASPTIGFGAGAGASTGVMLVMRSDSPNGFCELDLPEVTTTETSSTTITITPGITTTYPISIAIAGWATMDNNTWGSISGSGWNVLGNAQYRNSSSSGSSLTFAYKYQSTEGATGAVSKTQLAEGPEAALTKIMAFRFVPPNAEFVDADGKEITVANGDSNGSGVAPTVYTIAANTLYRSINGLLTDVATTPTQSVDNDPNIEDVYGSCYQRFAELLKATNGRVTTLVNVCLGGGELGAWSSGNSDYVNGVTQTLRARRYLLLQKARRLLVQLGVNDIGDAGVTTAEIQTYAENYTTRAVRDYPDAYINWTIPGSVSAGTLYNNAKNYALASKLVALTATVPSLYLCGQGMSFRGSGDISGDGIHYTSIGQNTLGAMFARMEINAGITDKLQRGIVSSMHDELSSGRKTLITDFIGTQQTASNYLTLETFFLFKNTVLGNACVDYTWMGGARGINTTFTAGTGFLTNGSTGRVELSYKPSFFNRAATQNDVIVGVYVSAVPAGACTVFGGVTASIGMELRQTASGLEYRVNQGTYRAVNGTFLAANHWYFIARNGGDQYLIQDTTILDTDTSASTGNCAEFIDLGALNSSSTRTSFGAFTFQAAMAAQYSTLNLSGFVTAANTLISGY